VTAGIARAALRSRPASFAGSFAAVLFAALVVSASLAVLATTSSSDIPAAARRVLDASGIGEIGLAFLLISIYLSIFVVASTMGTAVAQQSREFALLRAVGARPWQLRRAVAAQAVAAAAPAALVGCVAGSVLGRLWFQGMVHQGLVPADVRFRFTWLALPATLAVGIITSMIAGVIASLRPAGLRPAKAVGESLTPRRRLGLIRGPLGVVAIAGGVALSAIVGAERSDEAGQQAFIILLLLCCGVGLLGPRIIGPVAWGVAFLARPFGAPGQLSMLNLQSHTRRYSAAIVPIVLVVAFGVTKLAAHTTAQHLTGSAGDTAEVWLDFFGTAIYTGFAAIAAANTLVMITMARRRDVALLRLAGATRGQILGMVAWEASLVALTSLVIGTGIAFTTLTPLIRNTLGATWPYLPWRAAAAIAGGAWLLTLLSTVSPVAAGPRRAVQIANTT
jgi:putative ABC transport system permease protein